MLAAASAMMAMMECTIRALPAMRNIISFTAMCALLFGLSGIYFFSGSLRRYCVLPTGELGSFQSGWILGLLWPAKVASRSFGAANMRPVYDCPIGRHMWSMSVRA